MFEALKFNQAIKPPWIISRLSYHEKAETIETLLASSAFFCCFLSSIPDKVENFKTIS